MDVNKKVLISIILLSAIALTLLYSTIAYATQNKPKIQTLNDWQTTGNVKTDNSSTTLTVNSTTSYSAISKKINVTAFHILSLEWVDSANLESATYEVRLIQGDRVVASVFRTSDASEWFADTSAFKMPHSKTQELPSGEYTIVYSLQGTKGNFTLSEVYLSTNESTWLAQKIDSSAPLLIVLAIGAGMAASASYTQSLKQDVERLKTLLSLRQ